MRRACRGYEPLIAVMVVLISLQPLVANPVQSATGKISGRVLSNTGRPVKYARVELHRVSDSDSAFVAETRADARGSFTFENVAPGRYALRASQIGFFAPESERAFTEFIELLAGQHAQDLDLVLIAGGAIAGRVFDEDSDPMIAVEVMAVRLLANGEAAHQSTVQTDDRGAYRFFGLPPGQYVVGVRFPDHGRSRQWTLRYFPSALSRQEATPISVGEGQEVEGIDIAFKPLKGARLMGRVILEKQGSPVRARLTLSGQEFLTLSTHTDSAGCYEFLDLPPGQYHVSVESLDGDAVGRWQFVHIPSQHPVRHDFALPEAARVEGWVELEDRRPLDPMHSLTVSLTMTRIEGPEGAPSMISKSVEPDGTFRIGGLPKGRARLSIFSPNERYYIKALMVGGREVPDFELSLHPGITLSNVRVVLSDETGEIHGRVEAEEGDMTAYRLLLISEDPTKRHDVEQVKFAWTTGPFPFIFRGIPAGRYWLFAVPVEVSIEIETLIERHFSSARMIKVRPRQIVEVRISPLRKEDL
ncbi:MAG: carboxypeptidase-like regulatory domain-containing protein [Blastocatellia bacterium]|nr:carboxypeptidase-like regulatory domain-containing protein [Blastocatellia bacterium]MCS7157725.1 carboxypeptidase-like regulatory domain-containing protein [Blastocatellia bacterium]MCX7751990.1 carboxypeptidase-like regulatory domain-containing protein [Blastocatellia bacterium]MDW8167096.1 carboxypeptidase-like regulatory domain-containing protein [Acidobacteriota bacterium]MDW8257200.1 carboxypeptidase-like regulatory domain-containing protein [Acidobacteriota bacterium]